MDTPPRPELKQTTRDEKLSALSALLGPDAMARLREGPLNSKPSTEPAGSMDADRVAWHQNKLLERLRQHAAPAASLDREKNTAPLQKLESDSARATASPSQPRLVENARLDTHLRKISRTETLGQEHPAIIARLIKSLPREDRVDALKALPGPVARSILQRLR